jgi:hypothetical protein
MFALNSDGALAHELIASIRPQTLTPHTAQWFEDDVIMYLEDGRLMAHAQGRSAVLEVPRLSTMRARGRSWLGHLHTAPGQPIQPLIGMVHGQALPDLYRSYWLGDIADTGDVALVDPTGERVQLLRASGGVQYVSTGMIGPPRFSPDGLGVLWPTDVGWDVAIGQTRLTVRALMPELPVAALFLADNITWWIAYQVGTQLRCHQVADPTVGHAWPLDRDLIDLHVLVDDQVYLVWQGSDGQIHREPGFAPGFDMLEFDAPQETRSMSAAPFRYYTVCASPAGDIYSAESLIEEGKADVRIGPGYAESDRLPIPKCPALAFLVMDASPTGPLLAGVGTGATQELTLVHPDGRILSLGPTVGTQQVVMTYIGGDQFAVAAVNSERTWGRWIVLRQSMSVLEAETDLPLPQGILGTSQGILGLTAGLEPVFTDQARTIVRAGQESTLTRFESTWGAGWSIGQGGPGFIAVPPTNKHVYGIPLQAPVPGAIATNSSGMVYIALTGNGVYPLDTVAAEVPAPAPTPTEPPAPTPTPTPTPTPDPETPTMMLPAAVHATYAAVVAKFPHTGDDDHRREMHRRAVATVAARHGDDWVTKSEHNTGWADQSTDALAKLAAGQRPVTGNRAPMFIWDMINGTTREVEAAHESEPLRSAYVLAVEPYDWLQGEGDPADPQDPPAEEPDDPTETEDILVLLQAIADMDQTVRSQLADLASQQRILQDLVQAQREHVSALHSAFNLQAAALARGFQAKGRILGVPVTLDVTPKPPQS